MSLPVMIACRPKVLDADLLRGWPLPLPAADADKDERGRVLIIGGSREIPGALLLAATAALRAGAGKLVLATGASVAPGVALVMPEARVIALPELKTGGFSGGGVARLASLRGRVDAVLLGPGMQDEKASCDFVAAVVALFGDVPVILDAMALGTVTRQGLGPHGGHHRALALTPHAGEFAHLTGHDKAHVIAQASALSADYAQRWNGVLVLKGACTHIATPHGQRWVHEGGTVGLAMSGSGDTLAGIIAGLAARGAELAQACAWGVVLHGCAGERLASRNGPLGYLARELANEIPLLMNGIGGGQVLHGGQSLR